MLDLILVPLVAALAILAINAYFGLHIIRRGVIFVDLAFAQIAALGSTVAFLLGFHADDPLSYVFAFLFTLLGALLFSFTRVEEGTVTQEAYIGISYVVASAAVILLSSFTPEGAEHIKETLTGSLIWATWPAVIRMIGVYAVIALFLWFARGPMIAVTFFPGSVRNVRLWDFVFYVTFGVVITFSVNLAGVLLIFSTLVIPAVIAFLYTTRLMPALILAWATGAIAIISGVAISFAWDITTGPLLVCAFGAVLIVATILRPFLRKVRSDTVEPRAAIAAER
jgi:zinc/manganese transport system permease protein